MEVYKDRYFGICSTLEGGGVVWACVKDYIINESDDYKTIGPHGFYYKLFEEEEGWGTR